MKIPGARIERATAYEIVDDPMDLNSGSVMQIGKRELASDGAWQFPAASVSALEVEIAT
jgi:hypothetical protein